MAKSDPILTPFRLKGVQLKNRIVSTPHAATYDALKLCKDL